MSTPAKNGTIAVKVTNPLPNGALTFQGRVLTLGGNILTFGV